MKLLIVSATPQEINPFLKAFSLSVNVFTRTSSQWGTDQIDVLISGVGMTHTAFFLGKYLGDGYDLVLNAGIAGSFSKLLTIGETVHVLEDCFADLGAEDDEQFLSIDKMGLPGTYEVKNEQPYLHPSLTKLPTVVAATVNKSHGNTQSIELFLKHRSADIESMEGAAFLMACNHYRVKAIQVRTISNYVEKRDRNHWNIPLAVKNLNEWLISFVKEIGSVK